MNEDYRIRSCNGLPEPEPANYTAAKNARTTITQSAMEEIK